MRNYSELQYKIIENIRANGRGAITGNLLQEQLLSIIDKMELQSFEGLATPFVTPVRDYTSEHVYIAIQSGDYSNFIDGLTLQEGDFYMLYKMPNEIEWTAIDLKQKLKGDKGEDGADGSLLFPTIGIDASGNMYVDMPNGNTSNLSIDSDGDLCVTYPEYN